MQSKGSKCIKVGILFKVESDFLLDAVAVEAGESYGDVIQRGGHYEFGEKLFPRTPLERQFKAHAYGHYPRNRAVYFLKRKTYRLYADRCLTSEDIHNGATAFGLNSQPFEVAEDAHYRCARCNPHYLEWPMSASKDSKFLSYILRHNPSAVGVVLDENGWAVIDELLAACARHGRRITLEQPKSIVAEYD